MCNLYVAEETWQKEYTVTLANESHSRLQISRAVGSITHNVFGSVWQKRRVWDCGREMRQLGSAPKDWAHHAKDPSQATSFPLT